MARDLSGNSPWNDPPGGFVLQIPTTVGLTRAEVLELMPKPAAINPLQDAVARTPGNSLDYSRADHIHPTSFQFKTFALADTGGVLTWVFDNPYVEPPIVWYSVVMEENATLPYVVNLLGNPTTTQVKAMVAKAKTQTLGSTLLNIAGTVISPFAPAGPGVSVTMFARKAS